MFAEGVPRDAVLRTRTIWDPLRCLSTNVRILPVGERFYGCCHGGDVALNTTESVGRPSQKPLKRIQTGVGVENSRLETKFARTRASTLRSGRYERGLDLTMESTLISGYVRELHLEIQSFLPQNSLGPGWFPHRASA